MKKEKTIFIVFFLVFAIHLIFRIYSYREHYTSRFDPIYWEKRYNESQWVIPYSKNPIGDDGLFTYAGWRYIKGENPINLVPGYPPLGIYLVGISTFLFNNQNIFGLLSGVVTLIVYFFLNTRLFVNNKLLAFIPVFILSFDPLFYEQLRAPFLDLISLFFLLLTMFFFLNKRYFLSSIFLGCFALIKFSFLALVLIISCLLFLVITKNYQRVRTYLVSLSIACMLYIAAYARFFLLGHSLREFFGVHKWIIEYYSIGARAQFGIVYPLISFGWWYRWWDIPIRVTEWTLLWPISFVSSIISVGKILAMKKDPQFLFISLWIISYLFFLSFIPVFPRYLLLLLPFMYNLMVWFLLCSKSIKLK